LDFNLRFDWYSYTCWSLFAGIAQQASVANIFGASARPGIETRGLEHVISFAFVCCQSCPLFLSRRWGCLFVDGAQRGTPKTNATLTMSCQTCTLLFYDIILFWKRINRVVLYQNCFEISIGGRQKVSRGPFKFFDLFCYTISFFCLFVSLMLPFSLASF
jgi:hypothetical protein